MDRNLKPKPERQESVQQLYEDLELDHRHIMRMLYNRLHEKLNNKRVMESSNVCKEQHGKKQSQSLTLTI